MPIALFTGLPGAGKTAQLVAEIVRLREVEPGRPIFAMGINGLKEGLAIELTMEMLEKWWELPPGSIICIDECQEEHLMPKDRGMPAHWVQRITKVRHHGMDFLLTTQDPCNMSAYVRRLVDKHVLTIRKFGTQVINRYTWGRCIDDPYSRREQKQAVLDVATLPAKVFELYTSSQLHTMKRRIPMKVWLLGAAVLAVVACVVAVPVYLHRMQHISIAAVGGGDAALKGDAAAHVAAADQALRQKDMAKWMRPRVDGVPWSAPMFDKLDVQAQPRLYCVAVEDGRCTCNTEQGTHYEVALKQCRQIVADGLYNPFLAPTVPDTSQQGQQGDADQRGRRPAALPPAGHAEAASVADPVESSGTWKVSPLQAAYVPPELMSRPTYSPTQLQ